MTETFRAQFEDGSQRAIEKAGVALVVVGTGIQWAGQTTLAAKSAIETADRVFFAVADPWAARWVRTLNPAAEALPYARGATSRQNVYREMVRRIVEALRHDRRVCAAFYGSPALLTQPAHDAVRVAREKGFSARMLPGISSLDCVFADLDIDPGYFGCQFLECSDLLARPRAVDTCSHLVLFQPALIGTRGAYAPDDRERVRRGLQALTSQLVAQYGRNHSAVLYEASQDALQAPRTDRIRLLELPDADVSEFTTIYVPPRGRQSALRRSPAERNTLAAPSADEPQLTRRRILKKHMGVLQ